MGNLTSVTLATDDHDSVTIDDIFFIGGWHSNYDYRNDIKSKNNPPPLPHPPHSSTTANSKNNHSPQVTIFDCPHVSDIDSVLYGTNYDQSQAPTPTAAPNTRKDPYRPPLSSILTAQRDSVIGTLKSLLATAMQETCPAVATAATTCGHNTTVAVSLGESNPQSQGAHTESTVTATAHRAITTSSKDDNRMLCTEIDTLTSKLRTCELFNVGQDQSSLPLPLPHRHRHLSKPEDGSSPHMISPSISPKSAIESVNLFAVLSSSSSSSSTTTTPPRTPPPSTTDLLDPFENHSYYNNSNSSCDNSINSFDGFNNDGTEDANGQTEEDDNGDDGSGWSVQTQRSKKERQKKRLLGKKQQKQTKKQRPTKVAGVPPPMEKVVSGATATSMSGTSTTMAVMSNMELRRRRFQTYRESLESIPSNMLYYQDERVFIIKDKYPKSIHHYLILPREDIEGIRYLRTDQGGIELVEVLEQRGLWLIERLKSQSPQLDFMMGFHVFPSMFQLHMHVLSTDFCSPTRFQAQCYNAFTTQLFLSISDLRWYLDDRGSFELTAQELTAYANGFANEMKCLHCQCVLPDMDFLRSHMKIHLARRQSASGGQRQNPQDQHPSEKTEVKMIEIDTLATTSL